MTLAEFKAWLEGFETAFKYGKPSSVQWDAIKDKLATVDMQASHAQTAGLQTVGRQTHWYELKGAPPEILEKLNGRA